MDEKSAVAIDGIVALQRTLDPGALETLRQRNPRLRLQLAGGQMASGIGEGMSPREKSAFAVDVLGVVGTRCETGLKRALALIHLQRRIRRVAGAVILIGAVVTGVALASDRTGIAMAASITVVVAAIVLIFSECLVTSPRSDSVDPQTAYVRLYRVLTRLVAIRTELQLLSRHDERETELGDALMRANTLAQAIVKDEASLLRDPDDSGWDQRPIVAPMQA